MSPEAHARMIESLADAVAKSTAAPSAKTAAFVVEAEMMKAGFAIREISMLVAISDALHQAGATMGAQQAVIKRLEGRGL